MLKNISNLGKTLTKDSQKNIFGGRNSLTSGLSSLCSDGQFPCMCNFHFVGCYTSVGACQSSCEHHF